MSKSFLINQYKKDRGFQISHNYLTNQFKNYSSILKGISKVVKSNEFTLGREVEEFEKKIGKLINAKYVVAVGSGTDAIMLSLKALGINHNDEVIAPSFTFYATIGAIACTGAKPIFADVNYEFNIDPDKIEKKITKKTKAIVVVHWSGRVCEMNKINKISKKYNIPIIEDSCHAILATYKNRFAGSFGSFGCFSMHPLKNLNIWGDGGFVVCSDKKKYKYMQLIRNHGLVSRNKNIIYGHNSRLDTIQAVVAMENLKKLKFRTNQRIKNSNYLNKNLKKFNHVQIKNELKNGKEVFHLYEVMFESSRLRNKIYKRLQKNGIDAKIHYPIPMHKQLAYRKYTKKKIKLPITEDICGRVLSLPVHEFIQKKDLDKIIKIIEFNS
jgi:aminotransferase EvaB